MLVRKGHVMRTGVALIIVGFTCLAVSLSDAQTPDPSQADLKMLRSALLTKNAQIDALKADVARLSKENQELKQLLLSAGIKPTSGPASRVSAPVSTTKPTAQPDFGKMVEDWAAKRREARSGKYTSVQSGKLVAEADDALETALKSLGAVELAFKVQDVQTISSGTMLSCAPLEELSALATKYGLDNRRVHFTLQMTAEQASSIQRGDRIKLQGRLELKNEVSNTTILESANNRITFVDAKLVTSK